MNPDETELSPYSIEVIGLLKGEEINPEQLQAELQKILNPYGVEVRVIGGV